MNSRFAESRWTTKKLPLTEDMKEQGVIFASQINAVFDKEGHGRIGTLWLVKSSDSNPKEKIQRLKNTSFFRNMAHIERYHVTEYIYT